MKQLLLQYSPLLITMAFTVAGLAILVRMLSTATRQREQELDLRQQSALLFDRITWGKEQRAESKGKQPLKPIAPSTRTDRDSSATSTRRAVPTLPLCSLENASARKPLRLAIGKA